MGPHHLPSERCGSVIVLTARPRRELASDRDSFSARTSRSRVGLFRFAPAHRAILPRQCASSPAESLRSCISPSRATGRTARNDAIGIHLSYVPLRFHTDRADAGFHPSRARDLRSGSDRQCDSNEQHRLASPDRARPRSAPFRRDPLLRQTRRLARPQSRADSRGLPANTVDLRLSRTCGSPRVPTIEAGAARITGRNRSRSAGPLVPPRHRPEPRGMVRSRACERLQCGAGIHRRSPGPFHRLPRFARRNPPLHRKAFFSRSQQR